MAVLLLTLGLAAGLYAREASGGAALIGAVAVKVSAAVAAPFMLLGARRRNRFLLGCLAAAVAVAFAAGLAFGPHWLNSLTHVSENQGRTSHMSIPITAARLTGLDPDPVRLAAFVLYAVGIAYLLVWTWRGGDWLRATAWSLTGLLLATAWLLPWYLFWPLPATALSRDRALQALLLALTAYQLGARIPL
jgi:hypothetical protein